MGVGDRATRHPDFWVCIGLAGPSRSPGVVFLWLAPACVQTRHACAPKIAHFCTFRHVAPHTPTRHPDFWASIGVSGPSRFPGLELWCLAPVCVQTTHAGAPKIAHFLHIPSCGPAPTNTTPRFLGFYRSFRPVSVSWSGIFVAGTRVCADHTRRRGPRAGPK